MPGVARVNKKIIILFLYPFSPSITFPSTAFPLTIPGLCIFLFYIPPFQSKFLLVCIWFISSHCVWFISHLTALGSSLISLHLVHLSSAFGSTLISLRLVHNYLISLHLVHLSSHCVWLISHLTTSFQF